MDTLVNFLRENWQFISAALVVALEIIILIFKRKKVVVEKSLLTNFYTNAMAFIKEAEDIFKSGQGEKKLEFVVQRLKELYPSLTKELDSTAAVWNPFSKSSDVYISIVEDLLSLPEKKQKGVNDGKK